MDKHEYLKSGILESYVMGNLANNEMEAITTEIEKKTELKAEVERIEQTLLAYAAIHSPSISPKLEQQILAIPKQQSPNIAKQSATVFSSRFIVGIVGILIVLISSYFVYNNSIKDTNQLSQQLPNKTSNEGIVEDKEIPFEINQEIISQEVTSNRNEEDNIPNNSIDTATTPFFTELTENKAKESIIINHSDNDNLQKEIPTKQKNNTTSPPKSLQKKSNTGRIIPLQNLGRKFDATAHIKWFPTAPQYIILNATFLPPPPSGKVYQLWGLIKNKDVETLPTFGQLNKLNKSKRTKLLKETFTPLNLGVLKDFEKEVDKEFRHKLNKTNIPNSFIITIEPIGGSDTPNYKKILVFG